MARQGKETRDEDRTGKETRGQKGKTGTGKERREDETRTGHRTGEETRGQKKKRGTGKERREKRWREEELAKLPLHSSQVLILTRQVYLAVSSESFISVLLLLRCCCCPLAGWRLFWGSFTTGFY